MKNEKIISISCVRYHCIALTGLYFYFKFISNWNYFEENGQIYSWGYNQYGQLGLGKTTNKELIPSIISIEDKIISIGCGSFHSIVLSSKFIIYFIFLNNYYLK